MAEIYKITNTLNGEVYIGQTQHTTEIRFKSHLQAYYGNKESVLYRAFDKYGLENFTVETLEECEIDHLDEREAYWIKQYNSFNQGYNSTLGGHIGRRLELDTGKILELWGNEWNITNIAHFFKVSHEAIKNRLITLGVSEIELNSRHVGTLMKEVVAICFETRNIIAEFSSTVEASQWANTQPSQISNACRGVIKSSSYLFWRFKCDVLEDDYEKGFYTGKLPERDFGEFRRKIDYNEVCGLYLEGKTTLDISLTIGCTEKHIRKILNKEGVYKTPNTTKLTKKVIQLDSLTEEYVACYYSVADASDYVCGNRRSKHISRAAQGEYETAYGYKWRFCHFDCQECPY